MQRSSTTAAITYVLTIAVGTILVGLNDWFGWEDLLSYAIFTIPFALGAAPAVAIVLRITSRVPVWVASTCAFILGIVFGCLSTCVIAILLGPSIGAMSVPILQAWCVTAALIFSVAIVARRTSSRRATAIAWIVFMFLSIVTSAGFESALSLATGNQHLTVFFFRYEPGDNELYISDPFAQFQLDLPENRRNKLDDKDLALLKQSGLRGRLVSLGAHSSNSTTWPRAKAIIIFTSPMNQNMSLPQPKHCSIVYVQDNGGFRLIPLTASTFTRQIRIKSQSTGLHYDIERSDGGQTGGHIRQ